LPTDRVVAGIDVGEDFLYLALIHPRSRRMELTAVDLRDFAACGTDVLDELEQRLKEVAPELVRGSIAVIDSPRWPRDLDWSQNKLTFRPGEVDGRAVDVRLQKLIRHLRQTNAAHLRLSMFPTPKLAYFLGQLRSNSCKPHLVILGRHIFGDTNRLPASNGGGSFTRFMLSGFATYRALGAMRVTCYEGFPDLQFRLWSSDHQLPSKMRTTSKRSALGARLKIITETAHQMGISGAEKVCTLDHADAAVLALSVFAAQAAHTTLAIEHRAEGRFFLSLPAQLANTVDSLGL
jgi:hypothetical protein